MKRSEEIAIILKELRRCKDLDAVADDVLFNALHEGLKKIRIAKYAEKTNRKDSAPK